MPNVMDLLNMKRKQLPITISNIKWLFEKKSHPSIDNTL